MLREATSTGKTLGGSRDENNFGVDIKSYDEKQKIHMSCYRVIQSTSDKSKVYFFIASGPRMMSAIASFCSSSVPSSTPMAQASLK